MTTEDPLPDLVRTLRGRAATERVKAAKDLGRLGWLARDALPDLVAHLDDPDPRVREAVAQAIGQMGVDALPWLARMLAHADKYVRRNAVWALGRLGRLARPLLPQLCQSLKDVDPRTASGAAQTLGQMGADAAEAIPALAEAMRGTNIVLCRLAAKALSQIGPPALPTLITHLQHSDPFVRGEAALAIGWMGPLARAAVPYLAEIVRGPRPIRTDPSFPGATPHPGWPSGRSVQSPSQPPSVDDPHERPTPPQNGASVGDSVPTDSAEETCRVQAAQALGRIGAAARMALDDLRFVAIHGPEPLRRAAELAIRQIEGG